MKRKKIKRPKQRNRLSYEQFFKEYQWVHYVLVGLLLLVVFILIFIFSNCFKDFSKVGEFGGWASMISGILTYIGSSFLGLVVFFNTWQRQKKEDEAEKLNIIIDCKCYVDEDNFRPYSKEEIELLGHEYKTWGAKSSQRTKQDEVRSYFGIRVRNLHDKNPMYMKIQSVYYVNEENLLKELDSYDFKATKEFNFPLDYKETNWCFIGINNLIYNLKTTKVIYIFNFKNVKGDEQYCFYFVNLFKNGINPFPIYVTKKEYEKSIKENKHPFGKYKSLFEFTGYRNEI